MPTLEHDAGRPAFHRRGFLGLAAAGGASLAVGSAAAATPVRTKARIVIAGAGAIGTAIGVYAITGLLGLLPRGA